MISYTISLSMKPSETDANCIIISSETFYLDVHHDLLRKLLRDFDIKVVVYLRRQDQLCTVHIYAGNEGLPFKSDDWAFPMPAVHKLFTKSL